MESELQQAISRQGITRVGGDTYTLAMPPDEDGRVGRECREDDCSPGYFKVKPGTGITGKREHAYCPYCRAPETPNNFYTKEQLRFVREKLTRAGEDAILETMERAFGGKRIGRSTDFISMQVSFKRSPLKAVARPVEEELQRVIICPLCSLDHAVFGLATWCPDCGADIFLAHVEAELAVVRAMLADVDRRREILGARAAARDIENCLEDVVSIFEAVGKALLGRHLLEGGMLKADVEELMKKKVRNRMQGLDGAVEMVSEHGGLQLLEGIDAGSADALKATFEKRHPITHNLGRVDRKYLEKAMTAEREGREVRVSPEEVSEAINTSLRVLSGLHARLFPAAPPSAPSRDEEHKKC